MKKIIVILVFVSVICAGVYFLQKDFIHSLFIDTSKNETPTTEENLEPQEDTKPKTQQEINQETVQSKIEKIKKRLALRGLISQGDEYFQNDQLTLALKNYLQAYRQNPQDEQIIKKLADTYFELHNYTTASRYYKELLSSPNFDTNTLALSIMYGSDITTPAGKVTAVSEIQKIGLSEEDYFYYETAIACVSDFHNCKIAYDEYGKISEVSETGTQTEITSNNLKEVKKSIENYRNFQVDDVTFKNALIIGTFYTNKNYPIAIELGKQLLEERESYKPIVKILADSYFKLGDFPNAKLYLSQYSKLDNNDGGISYLLGVIHSEEGDYVLSNIFLNKALKSGYTPTINIRRKLVHNYFLLDSQENIVNAFYDLIENDTYEKSDLEIAIYYYILYEKYDQAKLWIQKGFTQFPTEENFHGYLGWIRKETGDNFLAREEFKKGLLINERNPFLNFNIGLLEKETGNPVPAKLYFNSVIENSPGSEFAIQAELELKNLK